MVMQDSDSLRSHLSVKPTGRPTTADIPFTLGNQIATVMAVMWTLVMLAPVLINTRGCCGQDHSLPQQTDSAQIATALPGVYEAVQCCKDMMQSLPDLMKEQFAKQNDIITSSINDAASRQKMLTLETKLNQALGRVEELTAQLNNLNGPVIPNNTKPEEECPLSNGQQIREQVQIFNSSKDSGDLYHNLLELLDNDSPAYKQLEDIKYHPYPMYDIGWLGLKDLAEVLVLCGEAVNISDGDGDNMLLGAASHGQLQLVMWLIDYGADRQVTGNYGHTPLMSAAKFGHLEVVRYLVQIGADPTATDIDEHTARDLATLDNHFTVADYLSKFTH